MASVHRPLRGDRAAAGVWPCGEQRATIAKSFLQLAEHQVISPETAAALQRAVDIRDAFAVEYDQIDVARLHTATALDDLDRFGREVTSWLVRKAGPSGTAEP